MNKLLNFLQKFAMDYVIKYLKNNKEEVIKIKGKPNHIEDVRNSIHGPLIGKVTNRHDKVISLCSKALEPMKVMDGLIQINKAESWDTFNDGIKLIDAPALNFVYADIENNISLFVTGKVPIRKKGEGCLPVSGWDGKHDWVDEIPLDHMPKIINPTNGYIISRALI